jgi:hypothetical protein
MLICGELSQCLGKCQKKGSSGASACRSTPVKASVSKERCQSPCEASACMLCGL